MIADKITDRTWTRWWAGLAVGVVALAGAGCSSSSTAATTSTTSAVASSTAKVSTGTNMAGKRYCEVLLVKMTPAGLAATIYVSYPLNTCPESQFQALDAKAIASENGALFAELNGPRYWLMNKVAKVRTSATVTKTFGGIDMNEAGTVILGTNIVAAMAPYTTKTVNRETTFTFDKGREVYELVDADGKAWIMQAWCQIKDPTLSAADLPGLASKLTLPAGWTYRARKITAPLIVATVGQPAKVIQDNLMNSYSMETNG